MSLKTFAPLPANAGGPSLTETFNREVKKALTDFPQLQGRFMFINAPEDNAILDIDKEMLGIRSDRELRHILDEIKHTAEKAGSSMATKLGRDTLDVLVYTPLPFKMFTGKEQTQEMEAMAVFDHELGHLVVRGGYFSQDPTLRETAADTFAVLRHIQRYGDESKAIEKAGWRRAFDFVTSGDAGHFTMLAVDEIITLKDKLDIKNMTPQQTADLASRLALKHTPHADITNSIAYEFEPVRVAMERTRNIEAAMKTLADIILDDNADYYAIKIGGRALKPFLDGEVRNGKGETFELKGAYWNSVREELKTKLADLDNEGLLFGMPLKGAAPKADQPEAVKIKPLPHLPENNRHQGWKNWFRLAA
jgi:hypothetical protein